MIAPNRPAGTAWDPGSGPDPFVDLYCPATATAITSSTDIARDSLMPVWTLSSSCVLTAQVLSTTGFAFRVFDSDFPSDDEIAPRTVVRLSSSELLAGTASRGPVASLTNIMFAITLVP
ncbi:MAG: hypothetical protein INH41_31525 [Myxococcaceae bacterium]|nr:hypothetical protein [Myxococcaceae bacterium]